MSLAHMGIGFVHIMPRILHAPLSQVFMVSRSQEKGEAAAAQIRAHCGGFGAGVSLEVLQCDFIELRWVVL